MKSLMLFRKKRELAVDAARAPAQRHVEAEAVFGAEIGVADLEREIARVITEVIELFERRIPRRPRHAQRDDDVVVRRLPAGTAGPPSPRTR